MLQLKLRRRLRVARGLGQVAGFSGRAFTSLFELHSFFAFTTSSLIVFRYKVAPAFIMPSSLKN